MLIRLLCAHEMTKHVCKISRLNSKRLLRKLQKNVGGLLYFAAPCRSQLTKVLSSPRTEAVLCTSDVFLSIYEDLDCILYAAIL